MTIIYKNFYISPLADNAVKSANVSITANEKIKIIGIGITGGAGNCFIKVHRNQDEICNGLHISIIDSYTHRIPIDMTMVKGDTIVVSAYSDTAGVVYGTYEYEIM